MKLYTYCDKLYVKFIYLLDNIFGSLRISQIFKMIANG